MIEKSRRINKYNIKYLHQCRQNHAELIRMYLESPSELDDDQIEEAKKVIEQWGQRSENNIEHLHQRKLNHDELIQTYLESPSELDNDQIEEARIVIEKKKHNIECLRQ